MRPGLRTNKGPFCQVVCVAGSLSTKACRKLPRPSRSPSARYVSNNSKLCLVSRVRRKNGPIQWRQPLTPFFGFGCEPDPFHSHFVHVVAFNKASRSSSAFCTLTVLDDIAHRWFLFSVPVKKFWGQSGLSQKGLRKSCAMVKMMTMVTRPLDLLMN